MYVFYIFSEIRGDLPAETDAKYSQGSENVAIALKIVKLKLISDTLLLILKNFAINSNCAS